MVWFQYADDLPRIDCTRTVGDPVNMVGMIQTLASRCRDAGCEKGGRWHIFQRLATELLEYEVTFHHDYPQSESVRVWTGILGIIEVFEWVDELHVYERRKVLCG